MRLIDADKFKKDLIEGTEDALQVAFLCGVLTKEKEKQADQTLKGFLKDIDEQPTINGWISPDEDCPDQNDEIIFLTTKGIPYKGFYAEGYWKPDELEIVFDFEDIEVWLPMPETHKGE